MATLVKLSWQAESHAALGVYPPRVANPKKEKHETIINVIAAIQQLVWATNTNIG
jgi:hypothetical protein